MTEYDIPWKEVLDTYLKGFLQLCLPAVHDGIDWESPIENREQELPHLFPKSLAAGRVADKLFRAKFSGNDQPTWFLIHTEVQVSRQADFAERIFTCYYRILDTRLPPLLLHTCKRRAQLALLTPAFASKLSWLAAFMKSNGRLSKCEVCFGSSTG